MKTYEAAVKATKKEFYAMAIASVSSHPAQLFKIICSLTLLPQGHQNDRELNISGEAFASYFANKILSLSCNLPTTVDIQ